MKDPVNQETGRDNEFFENEALREHLVTCQRLAMLGRLSTLVTHEVNNQLTGVAGYAQLMLDNADAARFEKELEKINTSALRCQKLIREMRQIGRFVDGNKEVSNINIILESCLDLYRHQFKQKSHSLVQDFSPDVPSGEFDTPAVEQVFLNVIQNSFEAFRGRGGSLSIKTRPEGEKVIVTFEDDGPGLSESARANLYTPFFTTKEDLNCAGLGLAAAEMVMKAHGGTITIEDSPDGGTRVEIVFPMETSK
jgi:signal transduction histidine kinase